MGTRADFYVGRGLQAEWLGSIGWDGYPDGIDAPVLTATTEQAFREAVAAFAATRSDWTAPERGWPWPWEDSRTTDYAYAFEDGKVHACPFGRAWFDPLGKEPELTGPKTAVFPDMSAREKVAVDGRSGLVFAVGLKD